MKKILFFGTRLYLPLLLLPMFFIISACQKQEYTLKTTDDVNITGYLDLRPEKFSLFSKIIEKAGSRGYLGAYGNYTLFTPTDEAVKLWLQAVNKTNVDEFSDVELKNIVNYHLVMDTLNTKSFTDGKLQQLPLYGQYITTGVTNSDGISTYILNKEAKIIQSNIRVGNGVIQVIDHVLTPKTKTLAQIISENPRYSIFKKALEETKFLDSLNVDPLNATNTSRKFQTIIIESDSALNAAGFADYAALKSKLSSGDPTNHSDSLWLYIAYHIGPNANYLADVVSASSLLTLAPSEIVTTKHVGSRVLINEVEFNGKLEPGVELNRAYSDLAASNGVLHDANSYYKIKVRVPAPLYWDMQLDGLSQNPRHPSYGIKTIDLYPPGGAYSVTGSFSPSVYIPQSFGQNSQYQVGTPGNRAYVNGDLLNLSMSGPTSNRARPQWHDFRTPLLVKGLYKVWICIGSNSGTSQFQWSMNPGTTNEQIFSNLMSNGATLGTSGVSVTAPNSDNLMEAAGYKRYFALNTETAVNSKGVTINGDLSAGTTTNPGRLVGIANIKSTDRQWIRVSALGGVSGNNIFWLDMIHFIPVTMDQQYPRFSKSGTVFKRP